MQLRSTFGLEKGRLRHETGTGGHQYSARIFFSDSLHRSPHSVHNVEKYGSPKEENEECLGNCFKKLLPRGGYSSISLVVC